ncbi:PAS domain S-box protein [Mucilaginibacter sp. CAU 1740]|uniref:PAS domain S-box protein n=1 Tax=Mucilaginibacter sp. CAU 1740 TaxID=3140365 RepID=UPI00325BA966
METLVTINENDSTFGVLFYQNPLPAWIIETGTLKFIAVNNAAVKQYGYSREEFLNSTIALVGLPGEDDSYRALLNRSLDNQSTTTELVHIKKDGALVYVNVSLYSVCFCSNQCRMMIVNDITDKRFGVEMINAHNKKLEDLAFINSHLIRKPLANILGIIYTLDYHNCCKDEFKQSINMLKLSADELDDVIRKINLQLEV